LGVSIKGFCGVIRRARSMIYNWVQRAKSDRLEDAKPIALNNPLKLSWPKVKEVIDYIEKHGEIAANYVTAVRTGVSPSSVSNIRRKYITRPVEKEISIVKNHYGWLKRNACWSIDTMMVRFLGGWLYAMLMVEETSRLILSYRLCEQKLGIYASELLLNTMVRLGLKPLVVKHDRGREFVNDDFQQALQKHQILSLPSPGYYAPFNSITERNNRLVRKFTIPLEIRYDATLEEMERVFAKAQRDINHELPRKIFDGKTSQEIYDATPDYEESEREQLIETVYENQEIEDGKYFLGGKELDRQRQIIVEYLCQRKLCFIEQHTKTIKLKLIG
jgi:hypothetical protein